MSERDLATDFQREYDRIGYRPGERWPFPADVKNQQEILQLMRRVPDGAGLDGWLAVLAERVSGGSGPAA